VSWHELKDWSGALDVKPDQIVLPGKLMMFCRGGETARQGYRRRLVETAGVVAGSENELGTSLVIQKISFRYPLQFEFDQASKN
jgi:hypothetical protein